MGICDPAVTEALERWAGGGFSGAVAISGPVDCFVGVGSPDEGPVPSADDVFSIGSVSKTLTGVAVAKLVEDGTLTLDDTAGAWLPELRSRVAEVTIEQLLVHTGGLGDAHGADEEVMDLDDALAAIDAQDLLFPPGTDTAYSNSGFTLLAAIVERASGRAWRDYVAGEVLTVGDERLGGFWYGEPVAVGDRAPTVEPDGVEPPRRIHGPLWAIEGNGPDHRDPGDPLGLSVTGQTTCRTRAQVAVDDVAMDTEGVARISLRFEARCLGASGALRGALAWDRSVEQGGPTNPATQVPASPWRPPAGAMPTDASAAYIEGESGEPVSGGRSYAWSNRVADFFGSAQPTGVAFSLYGDEYLDIDLTLPHGANRFRAGSYRDLVGDPPNPLRGLLRVSMIGNECDKPFGWVAIDSISYVGDAPVSVDLRFEQRCRSASAPALRGSFRWNKDALIPPALNPRPVPPDLWRPAEGTTPKRGSFLQLRSVAGDPFGGGRTETIVDPLVVRRDGPTSVRAYNAPTFTWDITFTPPRNEQLRAGLYGDIGRNPYHNPREGGIGVARYGGTCNDLVGWFAVDRISWQGTPWLTCRSGSASRATATTQRCTASSNGSRQQRRERHLHHRTCRPDESTGSHRSHGMPWHHPRPRRCLPTGSFPTSTARPRRQPWYPPTSGPSSPESSRMARRSPSGCRRSTQQAPRC